MKYFFILLSIAIILYSNTFTNQLFWDDDDNIINNSYLRGFSNIPKFFTENLIAGAGLSSQYYRPMLLLSFFLDFKIWKLHPFGYHLTNSLLHFLSAFLIFKIFSLVISKKIAFGASLLFLIHPIATEAVTYVSGRADPLSAFFMLFALLAYLSFYFKKTLLKFVKKDFAKICLSLKFFALALLAKETAIVFPGIIFLMDFVFLQKEKNRTALKNSVFHTLPFLALSVIYFILRLTALNFGATLNLYKQENIFTSNIVYRIYTFLSILPTYARLIFFPAELHMERISFIYTRFFERPVFFGTLLLLFLFCLIFYFLKKKNYLPLFGIGWFFIGLVPTSNILVPTSGLLYEHWLYWPNIGIYILVSSFLIYLRDERKLIFKITASAVSIFFLFFFSYQTIARNFDWRDPITFYEKTLKYTPGSLRVRNNLANAYSAQGELEKAKEQFLTALQYGDYYPQIHFNLANVLRDLGETESALEEYAKAAKMDPNFALPHEIINNLQKQLESSKPRL